MDGYTIEEISRDLSVAFPPGFQGGYLVRRGDEELVVSNTLRGQKGGRVVGIVVYEQDIQRAREELNEFFKRNGYFPQTGEDYGTMRFIDRTGMGFELRPEKREYGYVFRFI